MKKLVSILLFMALQSPVFAIGSQDISNNSIDAGNPIDLISKSSQYVRITGVVDSINISEHSKVIFLNFGKNYNTSFSAMIYNTSIPSFITAGITEPDEFFKNKIVTVEGILRMSNGKPEMVIDSPNQIKIVTK